MSGLIWDIQEEHFGEAEFLLEFWAAGLDAPTVTLARLRDGPEERLQAHLDGLRVGGHRVIENLLLPVLDEDLDDDEYRTATAALAILQSATIEICEQVLSAATGSTSTGRRGITRALALSQREGLLPWLARDLDQLHGASLVTRLHAFAHHRVDVANWLVRWLSDDDLEVRRAAARLARHATEPELLRHLYAAMHADDDELRWAAIESGLIRGLPNAWAFVCEEALGPRRATARGSAWPWLAMLGDEGVHRRLLFELEREPSPELVRAAGLSGRAAAVDAVLDLLDHTDLARLAGEVVCVITGAPIDEQLWLDHGRPFGLEADDALPELADDDLEQDLVPRADDSLPLPDAHALRSWWTSRRAELHPGLRHFDGRPLDRAVLLERLLDQPNRRRHPLALELAARTAGAAQISTSTWTFIQSAQMSTVFARLGPLELQRGHALVI